MITYKVYVDIPNITDEYCDYYVKYILVIHIGIENSVIMSFFSSKRTFYMYSTKFAYK